MPRIYKFRGKRVDNSEWVFGNFVKAWDNSCYIITEFGPDVTCCSDCGANIITTHEVIPETVGQYTGLTDMNGKEIYDGDIIPYHFNNEVIGVVKYGEYHNSFNNDNHGGHIGFYLEWNEDNSVLREDLCYWIKVSEVDGNIHDDPELLTL